MDKKVITPTILFILILVVAITVLVKNSNKQSADINIKNNTEQEEVNQDLVILFYGNGCPHCAIVEEFLKDNDIQELISFDQKEVYYNQQNANELATKAKICGIPSNSIGVPFLWDGSKCYVGDQDIINFFEQKITK